MLPDAEVVHRIPGRLRLRILSKRKDVIYFAQLAEQIKVYADVREVTINPLTGSLLVLHVGPFEGVAEQAERQGLFKLAAAPVQPSLQDRMVAGLKVSSRNLEAVSGGEFDLNGLLIVGLTGLAIHQAIEGNVMVPAISLLWYALNAAGMPMGRDKPVADARAAPEAATLDASARVSKEKAAVRKRTVAKPGSRGAGPDEVHASLKEKKHV
ncbi:MAG: hypothetical protein HXY26_06045 [Hydrogenophilaceae bacterium]|nr:hypothetical protein [Hydrogenophilaceae bacterium]